MPLDHGLCCDDRHRMETDRVLAIEVSGPIRAKVTKFALSYDRAAGRRGADWTPLAHITHCPWCGQRITLND